ncbi:MAG: hypothetical protein WC651_02220 [Candidatus Gracilibacteria bacterium]|jgi:hypothetical protein
MMEEVKKIGVIRSIYLYLVTAISIVVLLICVIGSLNIVIREYVFGVHGSWDNISYPMDIKGGECSEDNLFYSYDSSGKRYQIDTSLSKEDKKTKVAECTKAVEERNKLQNDNQMKRDFAQYLAMFLVSFPLYLYHWRIIKKEANK